MSNTKRTPGPQYGTDHIFGWVPGGIYSAGCSGTIEPAKIERVYGVKGCVVYVLMRRDALTVVNNQWLKTRRRMIRESEYTRWLARVSNG